MTNEEANENWQAVIARSLSFLCLIQADLRDKSLGVQAQFLEALGLPIKDAAALLGTTDASIRELLRLARKQKGNKRGGKKR